MKKTLALILAALTVLPFFAACQNTSDEPEETKASTEETQVVTETEDPYKCDVPYTDYEEHTFMIMCPSPDDWGIASYDREEETADQVNDAIYNRNRTLESKFNITIDTIAAGDTGSQANAFQTYAMSGKDVIDMIAVGFYQSGKPLICNDYVLPWNDVEYINLEKGYWNKSVSETLAVLGNYYYLVGDVNWFTMPEVSVCYFNKNVAETNKSYIDGGNRDLYNMVIDGDWTFDALYDIAKEISVDNGDGVWDTNDTYGCIQNTIIGVTGFVYAANYQTVYMTEDGPVLNFNTETMQNIVNYLIKLCCKNNVSYTETFDFTNQSKGIPVFFDDRALFYFDILMHAETFRAYDSDFGIIPYPKYDTEQTSYVSYANQWGLCCALPCTASDTSRTGEILEAMSALSNELIVPAYYDKTLIGKVKRDTESEPMLDIIFDNILYDFGICFCTDLKYIVAKTFVESKTTNLTSWYKSYQKKLNANYTELYEHVYESIHGELPDEG